MDPNQNVKGGRAQASRRGPGFHMQRGGCWGCCWFFFAFSAENSNGIFLLFHTMDPMLENIIGTPMMMKITIE